MSTHMLGVARSDGGQDFADGFDIHECSGKRRYAAEFEDTPDGVLDVDANGDTLEIQGWADGDWFCEPVAVDEIESAPGGVYVQFLGVNEVKP